MIAMTQDELTLTEDDKKSGFTSIKRDGRFKSGIEFNIKGIIFTLPIRPRDSVESIFARYKKRLMDQSLPIKINEFSEICNAIENTIMRHFDWMIGEDIRRQKEGYTTINSDSTIVDTTFEDKTDDNDFSTYVKVSISESIGKHSGKIQFEGVIASAATDKMQFLKRAIWRCYACKEYTTREVFNILDIPNNPTECRSCETKAGFAHCHKYINSRLLKIQSENNTNDTALELLPVYVLNQHTDNIQLSGRVKIYGRIAKGRIQLVSNFIL